MRDDMHAPRFDRRHDSNLHQYVTIIALVITLVVQVATISWGAAKLSSAVEELNAIVRPLVVQQQQDHNDLSVLKDRLNRGKDGQ